MDCRTQQNTSGRASLHVCLDIFMKRTDQFIEEFHVLKEKTKKEHDKKSKNAMKTENIAKGMDSTRFLTFMKSWWPQHFIDGLLGYETKRQLRIVKYLIEVFAIEVAAMEPVVNHIVQRPAKR